MMLGMVLKSLGVHVSDADVAAVEALIPQIPGKVKQCITVLNGALSNFDQRLLVIETNQKLIMEKIGVANGLGPIDTVGNVAIGPASSGTVTVPGSPPPGN